MEERNRLIARTGRMNLLLTDLAESNELAEELAEELRRRAPQRFAGNKPCVFFKLRYIPPYEKFSELRSLILSCKRAAGLRADYKGVVALEVSEWLGHEKEEYFTVMLKYLYDHTDTWIPVMVLQDCSEIQLRKFTAACAIYITPCSLDERVFTVRERLEARIRAAFGEESVEITPDAVRILADVLGRNELKHARSLNFLTRVVHEVMDLAMGCWLVDQSIAAEYLADPLGAAALVSGRVWKTEKGDEHVA